MRRLRIGIGALAIGLIIASFVVLQGRYGSDTAQAGGGLGVSATEFNLSPSSLSAPANTSFTVTLTNNGAITHNFKIDVPGTDPGTVNVGAGGSASQSFSLPDGTYTFYCGVGSHRQQGMSGTITIGTGTPAPPPPPPPPMPPPPPPPDIPPTDPPPQPGQPPADDSTEPATMPAAPPATTKGSLVLNRIKLTDKKPRALRLQSRVGCDSSSGSCRVTLVVKGRVGARLLAGAGKPRKRTVTLARKRLTLAAGSQRTLRVPLTKPGRKIFKKTRRLRGVTVVLRGNDDAGKLDTVKRTVRLTAPARR